MVKCKLCNSKIFKKNHHSIVHCIRLSTHGFSLCCDLRVRVIVERALVSSFQALKIDGSLDGLFNQPRSVPTYQLSPYALYVPVLHVISF